MYSENVIAGFGVALRIVQLPEFLCMGLFMGVVPLFAFSFAAKNKDRYEKTIKYTFIHIGSIVTIFSGTVFVFADTDHGTV